MVGMSGRATKRERRASGVERIREVWADEDYGLRLDVMASGKPVFRWVMDQDSAVNLMALERVRSLLEHFAEEWVLACRAEGDSWADIGLCLRITGEAARQRYGALEAAYRQSVEGGES